MTISLLFVLAQAGGGMIQPLFLLGFVAILYFFMLRPQAKKQKEQAAFSKNMSVGDKVVTIGGIHGKISRVNEDGTYALEGDRNTFFTVEASAISMEMTTAYRKKLEAKA
jgi:preprotein translocase subunit YajC